MFAFIRRLLNVLSYQENHKYLIYNAFKETLQITIFSCLLSIIIGLILGISLFVLKSNQKVKSYFVLNSIINFLISTPFLILIILFIQFILFPTLKRSYGFQVSFISLILVLTPHFGRHCEHIFNTLNPELKQTAYTLGASKIQFIFYFLLKEARADLVLKMVSLFITSLAYSSVLGIVGHHGIGEIAISHGYHGNNILFDDKFNTLDVMLVCVLSFFILTQIVQLLGNKIASSLDKR